MAEAPKTKENPAGPQTGQLAIQKVYVKDISFETPNSPQIFKEEWNPEVNMEMASDSKHIEDTLYEVVLSTTLTVKGGDKTVYLVETHQAGIFNIQGFAEEVMERLLSTVCPNILFPFARELVSDLVTRGGFPQLLLAPVNFDALYAQHKQRQQAESQGKAH